jgi:glutamate:GABA antiporter
MQLQQTQTDRLQFFGLFRWEWHLSYIVSLRPGYTSSYLQRPAETSLRRELGTRDLALFAISCIVGTRWIAGAAHAGPASITLFLLAAVFFVAPLSIAIGVLTMKHPVAGGLYIWTRDDFGPWHGFLCFWVYWLGIVVWFPSAAIFYMSAAAYTLGSGYAHLADNRTYVVAGSIAAIWVALGSNIIGIKIGKWTENIGGASTWILGAVLMTAAAMVWMRHGSATTIHLVPELKWSTVNFWGSIAFAMSGMELVGLMGGEIRDPLRTVPRAGWIASLFATLFYSGATLALLVLLTPERISEVNGLAQGGEVAGATLGAPWLSALLALLLLAGAVGQFGGLGSAVSRLPFAVGADGLLPSAFGKLHPRWATPYVALIILGIVASALLIVVQLGETMRAAYQELVSLMVITGFLPFLYVFASAWKAGRRVSAVCGAAMTAVAILCSIVPTDEIHNIWLFESKLALGTFGAIGSAFLLYRRYSARITLPKSDPLTVSPRTE